MYSKTKLTKLVALTMAASISVGGLFADETYSYSPQADTCAKLRFHDYYNLQKAHESGCTHLSELQHVVSPDVINYYCAGFEGEIELMISEALEFCNEQFAFEGEFNGNLDPSVPPSPFPSLFSQDLLDSCSMLLTLYDEVRNDNFNNLRNNAQLVRDQLANNHPTSIMNDVDLTPARYNYDTFFNEFTGYFNLRPHSDEEFQCLSHKVFEAIYGTTGIDGYGYQLDQLAMDPATTDWIAYRTVLEQYYYAIDLAIDWVIRYTNGETLDLILPGVTLENCYPAPIPPNSY